MASLVPLRPVRPRYPHRHHGHAPHVDAHAAHAALAHNNAHGGAHGHAHPDAASAAAEQRDQFGSIVDPNIPLYLACSMKGGLVAQYGQKPQLNVVVVGAGMAGLAAAGTLSSAGHNVTVFEASDRVGGRCHTIRGAPYFSMPSNYAEIGAMRIPDAHAVIGNYVKTFVAQGDFTTGPFNGSDNKSFYYILGTTFSIGEYQTNPEVLHNWLVNVHGYQLNSQMVTPDPAKGRVWRIDEMWEAVFQSIIKEYGYQANPDVFWQSVTGLYDVSFGDYLTKTAGWLDGTMELFGLIGSGIGGYESTYSSSFLENLREEISLRADINDPNSANFTEIKGGNDQLATSLFNYFGLTGNTQLNTSVTAFNRYNNNGKMVYLVSFTRSDGTTGTIDNIDHVVCTTTMPAMRSMDISPPWSTGKERAIRELHYQHASKVLLEFSYRWWNDQEGPLKFASGGAISTNLPVKNVYFPDWVVVPTAPVSRKKVEAPKEKEAQPKDAKPSPTKLNTTSKTTSATKLTTTAAKPVPTKTSPAKPATTKPAAPKASPTATKPTTTSPTKAPSAPASTKAPAKAPAKTAAKTPAQVPANKPPVKPTSADPLDDRTVVLASYTWEDDAIYWASKPAEFQVAEAYKELRNTILAWSNFDIAPYYIQGTVKNWTIDPATSGAYAFFNPTQMSLLFADIVATDQEGTFHFGGEHASFDHAWMEGALQSGLRCAIEVHAGVEP